jgi:diguanylate cyclase (GGDEF)-like protein
MSTERESATPGTGSSTAVVIGVILPIALIAVILARDAIESPKTAYVGVLSAIPLLSAVFARPVATAFVGAVTWLSALGFGWIASDGNVQAQRVRLVFIAAFALIAVAASAVRVQREARLAAALTLAAEAESQRAEAMTDPLTGLTNRRGLMEDVANRAASGTCVAMIDLDDLKAVNDEHGHLVGDEFIRGVAGRLRANLAGVDTVCRWGGDEFVVVLEIDPELAESVLRRAVTSVTAEPVATSASPLQANLSVGVTPWLVGEEVDAAISRADQAMYRAKGTDGSHVVAVLDAT